MGRTAAAVWHALFSIVAAGLYVFFVLPRWPELTGQTSPMLGTVLRIVTGALVGLAALPVVFTLLRTRRPEYGIPQLALTLRTSSIALHVFAGALIIGTAISEIWLNLDRAGQWLFGIYGAAAAIALLGVFAFYLAFVAEVPPPPPKPLKPKKQRRRRRLRGGVAVDD
jgi:MFS family permease